MSSSSSSSSRSSSSASLKADEPFCTEEDLVAERANIMNFGVSSWDDKIVAAAAIVTRDLDLYWYRGATDNHRIDWREFPFDIDLLWSSPEVKRLAVYKSLELIYRFLRKDSPPDQDAFEPQMKLYGKLYSDELKSVCAFGLDYDWDASGAISEEERTQPTMRRLTRC